MLCYLPNKINLKYLGTHQFLRKHYGIQHQTQVVWHLVFITMKISFSLT